MKYIITESQYLNLTEALGVPNSILEAAEEFYEIFLNDIKTINTKKGQYKFDGDVDIVLGDRKKIKIDEYSLRIDIFEIDEFDRPPAVSSMGMNQSFKFDRKLLMKRIEESTTAEFSIDYVVNPNWEPNELYEEFLTNKEEHISSLSHELKHKYDKQAKRIDLIGRDAEYIGAQRSSRFDIPSIDEKFLHYLYYTNVAENLVRTTEVASHIRTGNVSPEKFREFLVNNKTFQTLVEIRNFTFEDLVNGITENMDTVDRILQHVKDNPEDMTDEEKINKILRLVYVNLVNTTLSHFKEYTDGPMGGIFDLFRAFGGNIEEDDKKVSEIREKFQKYIIRYRNNPTQYFKDEINKFHQIASKMIKKLSKLYAMTYSNTTNESIVDWELHMKLMEKKYGKRQIETEIKKIV